MLRILPPTTPGSKPSSLSDLFTLAFRSKLLEVEAIRGFFLWLIKVGLRANGIIVDTKKPLKTFPRVGFSGELGYLLFGLLPYLNYIRATRTIDLETFGSEGSSAFFNFSDKHVELGKGSTSSWGTISGALRFRKHASFRDPIFVPVEWYPRRLRVQGFPDWESNKLHVRHADYESWRPPNLTAIDNLKLPKTENQLPSGKYCVVNIKNYLTWGNTYVANWYEERDLTWILQFCERHGLRIVANRSPVSADDDEPTVSQPFLQAFLDHPLVHDISTEYSKLSVSEGNLLQLKVLEGATHVWATQGGNALLAMMCNSSVSVLMKGGADYEDYRFFSKKAGLAFFEVIYSADQSRMA